MKAKIVCTYCVPGIQKLFDEHLVSEMSKIGAEFIGSGYDLNANVRDLEFEISIGPPDKI